MNDIAISLDTVWMLLAAMLVFFMQPGFALCEAGFTRSKNTANILMKNFVDFIFIVPFRTALCGDTFSVFIKAHHFFLYI